MTVRALRQVWRRAAPHALRRRAQPLLGWALENYVRANASLDHGQDRTEGPIKVVGFFLNSHGIAASAKLAVRAFEALGVPVEQVDISGSKLSWVGRSTTPQRASAWIFHLNPPEMLAALAVLGPRSVLGPRYGYWAWELPRAPDSWRRDSNLVDEIWAPSRYTAAAFAGCRAPVRAVPHPFFMEDYANIEPAPRVAAFQVLALFDFNSSAARKNPEGMIEAFRRAFGDDPEVRLTIKTQSGAIFPGLLAALQASAPSNVEILDASLPYREVKAMIAGADVLLSLHRAEGFGLTQAEAMALGTPVVATAFSGNLDFMDETNAELIPSTPAPVEDPQGIYKGQTWADPDLDAAAAALRRLRDDPARRAALADAGRRTVAERLSPEAWFATLPPALQAAAEKARAAAQAEGSASE